MRVSDTMFFELSRRNLQKTRSEAIRTQEQAQTGRRVVKSSDDPLAFALARREQAREGRAASNQRNIEAGSTTNMAADAALADVGGILRRAKELAVQGASDTLTAPERADIAREVEALRDTIVSLANAEVAGSYVFGGYADGRAPFDASGTYAGDGSVRQVEVAPGNYVDVSVAGDATFGVGTGTDVLASLDALRTALDTDDVVGIRAGIDTMDAAHRQISTARAKLSANVDALDVSRSVALRIEDDAGIQQGKLVGIDPIEAFLEFSKAQGALETAVQLAQQLPPAGLAQGG